MKNNPSNSSYYTLKCVETNNPVSLEDIDGTEHEEPSIPVEHLGGDLEDDSTDDCRIDIVKE